MQLPNYKYRYDSDNSKAPWQNVWSNIVLAYCPFLGKTGQRIEDLSGYNHYGSLTNEHTDNWTMVGYPGYTFDLSRTASGTSTTSTASNLNLDLSVGCTVEILYNYDYSAGAGSNQSLFEFQWVNVAERLRAALVNNTLTPLQWLITSGNNTAVIASSMSGGATITGGSTYWSGMTTFLDNSTNTNIEGYCMTRALHNKATGYGSLASVNRPPTNWTAANNVLIQLGINSANIHQHISFLIVYNRPMPRQFLQYRMANPFSIFEYDYPRMKLRAKTGLAASSPYSGLFNRPIFDSWIKNRNNQIPSSIFR